VIKAAVTGVPVEGMELEEVREAPAVEKKKAPSLEDAMRHIEEGGTIATKKKTQEPNRPRIVTKDREALSEMARDEDEEDEDRSELLQAVTELRGSPVDTKKRVEDASKPPAAPPAPHPEGNKPRFNFTPPKREERPASSPSAQQSSEDQTLTRSRHRSRNRHREQPEDQRRQSLEQRFDRAIEEKPVVQPMNQASAPQKTDTSNPVSAQDDAKPSATVFRSSSPRIVHEDDNQPFGGIRVQPGQRVRFDS
jgi:hypothetical protein